MGRVECGLESKRIHQLVVMVYELIEESFLPLLSHPHNGLIDGKRMGAKVLKKSRWEYSSQEWKVRWIPRNEQDGGATMLIYRDRDPILSGRFCSW